MVKLDSVHKTYSLGSINYEAIRGISLEINQGQFVAIVGPSGSGKTTLLNIIGCLEAPTSGKVTLNGECITTMNDEQLAYYRRRYLGFIFQNFNLLPVLSARENVTYPLTLQDFKLSVKEMNKRAEEALELVGLLAFINHKPMEMSGGQRQRVAIARALVNKPEIILADEPTANLDQKTGKEIIDLMDEINKVKHTTFIFSTHDTKIMSKAGKTIEVQDGLLV